MLVLWMLPAAAPTTGPRALQTHGLMPAAQLTKAGQRTCRGIPCKANSLHGIPRHDQPYDQGGTCSREAAVNFSFQTTLPTRVSGTPRTFNYTAEQRCALTNERSSSCCLKGFQFFRIHRQTMSLRAGLASLTAVAAFHGMLTSLRAWESQISPDPHPPHARTHSEFSPTQSGRRPRLAQVTRPTTSTLTQYVRLTRFFSHAA